MIERREFITLLSGAAARPLAAVAQQPKVWRIGVSKAILIRSPRRRPPISTLEL